MYVRDVHVMGRRARKLRNMVLYSATPGFARCMLFLGGELQKGWFSARHSTGLRRRRSLASASSYSSSCRVSSSSRPRPRRRHRRPRCFGACGQQVSGYQGRRAGRSQWQGTRTLADGAVVETRTIWGVGFHRPSPGLNAMEHAEGLHHA
jgi:hypothetical protein